MAQFWITSHRRRQRHLARIGCDGAGAGLSRAHHQGDHPARPPAAAETCSPGRWPTSCRRPGASRSWWRTGPAAGSTSAHAPARKSAPDGYTICVLSSEPVIYNQFLFKSLPFDPEKDFEPISNLFFNTLALVVNNSLKVRTIPELVALSKAKPGTLSYGTFAFPLAHFMEKLKKETGADIVRVPFRSGNEVVTAVLSGSTPVAILALSNMVPQMQSGHITALAINSKIALAAVSRHPDAGGGLRRRGIPLDLVRPVRAGRHPEADRREARGRGRAHPRRSRFPAADVHRARGRAFGLAARGLRGASSGTSARSPSGSSRSSGLTPQ